MKIKRQKDSFTLIEVLTYIAILSMVVLAASSFLTWAIKSNIKIKVMRETLDNARRGMEQMTYEIRKAESIYTPTIDLNQLSLETTNYLPTGETTTYIDFYLCGTQLCLKKEGQNPIALTSDRVEVTKLEFTQIDNSIQIDLKIDYKNFGSLPEYQSSTALISTISLR